MFVHFYSVCGLVVVNYFYLLVGRSVARLLDWLVGWSVGRLFACKRWQQVQAGVCSVHLCANNTRRQQRNNVKWCARVSLSFIVFLCIYAYAYACACAFEYMSFMHRTVCNYTFYCIILYYSSIIKMQWRVNEKDRYGKERERMKRNISNPFRLYSYLFTGSYTNTTRGHSNIRKC